MRSPRKHYAACAAVLACILAGGCVPSRQEVYDEINALHTKTYDRWVTGAGYRDEMPVVEGALTLTDAVKLALQYNPGLNGVIQEKEKARGRILQAYSEALPHLDATAGYTRTEGPGSAFSGVVNSYSAGLTVTQPVYKGGVVGAALRGARLFSYLSDESVREQVQTVAYNVGQLYWSYRLANHLHDVQKVGLESAQRQWQDVKAKLEQGVATEFDRLRAQVEVANFNTGVIQQRNVMRLTQAQLFRAMGVSQHSTAAPSEDLTYEPFQIPYEEAVRVASTNRPDLYSAELNSRLQKEALTVVRSGYLPTADAFVSSVWGRPSPQTFLDKWGHLWTGGVTVKWPIFDGLNTYGRMVQQQAEIRQSMIRQVDTAQLMLLQVRQAQLDLEDTQQLVEAQKLNQESARLALQLAEIGRAAGVRTDLQVIDARAALITAEGLYYQALYSHTVARMDMERAMGLLAPSPGKGEASAQVPVPGRFHRLKEFTRAQAPAQ